MSLSQQLISYIKLHGQVHFREIEKYAEDNGYKAYTAVRRLQEIRDPEDPHYDHTISTIEENGTIKWYTYKPNRGKEKTPPADKSTVQEKTPRSVANFAPSVKSAEPKYGRSYSVQCCKIYEVTRTHHTRACAGQT